MKYLIIALIATSAYSAPRDGFEERVIPRQVEYINGIWDNFRHTEHVMTEIQSKCGENYYIVTSQDALTDSENKTLKTTHRYDSRYKLVVYRCVKTANMEHVLDLVY